MDTTQDTRMPLTSHDVVAERVEALRELFPEAFTEGAIDFVKLKQTLGEFTGDSPQRYGLSWAGKSDAIRAVQSLSSGTLVPCKEESVKFDTTENLIIEGDNLEVLKLLQKSYYGNVKMIYIDPPYNTGNEFIYPDDYREGLDGYLRYSGQISDGGLKLETNTESSGRFHSKWLNMMYPRLFLARNLLRDDGAVFVSIDDSELCNLRLLMNEVFGEENFVATIIWQKVFSPKNTARHFSEDHDYIMVYARNAENWVPELLPRTNEADARYSNPDNDPRGPWTSSDLTARNYYSEGLYEVSNSTGKVYKPSVGTYWRVKHEKFLQLDADNRIWWGADGNSMPRLKRFLSDVKQGITPQTLWKYEDVGHTQEAKKEMLEYVRFEHTENVLDTVKPTRLIQRMLQIATQSEGHDVVVDFFAGSAPTAHAVIKQNREDGGNRRFVCVQLPEPLPIPEPNLKTIADIGKTRIKGVIEEFCREDSSKLDIDDVGEQDRGFKVFKLTSSNFKLWSADEAPKDADALAEQLRLYADHVVPGRSQHDILYELLLKAGLPLTASIDEKEVHGQKVFSVADGLLLICLEDDITQETLRGMIEHKPEMVLCLDNAFKGNDQLKTNIVLEMESHEIKFHTV